MGGTGIGSLLVRMVVSLAIVLAVVAVAYFVAKHKRDGGRLGGRPGPHRGSRRRAAPVGVEVVGRVGLSRGTAAVAVRFGDRIVLVAATDQGAPTTLSEMPATTWDELCTVREPIQDLAVSSTGEAMTSRPNFLDALRQATVRHA